MQTSQSDLEWHPAWTPKLALITPDGHVELDANQAVMLIEVLLRWLGTKDFMSAVNEWCRAHNAPTWEARDAE